MAGADFWKDQQVAQKVQRRRKRIETDLNLAQHAMLAGIPKAPSRNNPISGPRAGKERRNWILGRMLELGYIDTRKQAQASAEPVTVSVAAALRIFTFSMVP